MVAGDRNQLTGISGKAIKADGTDGAPFTGTTPSSITLESGVPVILTDGPPITVKSRICNQVCWLTSHCS